MKPIYKLIIAVLIPLAVGSLAGYFTASSVNGWYTTLVKPSFNPPNWLFAPVWTSLYIMMGIAFYLIWKKEANDVVKSTAVTLYIVQLALNFLWSFVFFYAQQPGWALVNIILMWIFIFLTILWFGKISSLSAWLLVPYICWVSFATVLNFAIWKLNP
ncbi:MAG: tryptophan-rich sensory protein [Ferruginibacter sp.]|nr:tryptophan-rich sensory protein [Ferruginibacter sp.]